MENLKKCKNISNVTLLPKVPNFEKLFYQARESLDATAKTYDFMSKHKESYNLSYIDDGILKVTILSNTDGSEVMRVLSGLVASGIEDVSIFKCENMNHLMDEIEEY